MRSRHVTHLIPRYVHGQLRLAKRAQVINHVRTCAECRAALAREERLVADLRREMPAIGTIRAGQLTHVWAGVWGEIGAPSRPRYSGANWLPGLSAMLVTLLLVALALPMLAHAGAAAHAGEAVQASAPHQALPHTLAPVSATPEGTDDIFAAAPVEIRTVNARATVERTTVERATVERATVAYIINVGASPAPMPGVTASPFEVVRDRCQTEC